MGILGEVEEGMYHEQYVNTLDDNLLSSMVNFEISKESTIFQ